MDLGEKGHIVFPAKADGCLQTCKASADYDHIVRDCHHETIKYMYRRIADMREAAALEARKSLFSSL
jgi:hypothetical protein